MAKIYIEGRPYDVPDGQNLLAVCLGLGFDLPFFCWHPAMGSVAPAGSVPSSSSRTRTTPRARSSWPV